MTDLRKLLPCPFCHSLAAMHSAPVFGGDHGFRIECEGICHAMTCYWHTEKQAVSAWNRRAALAEPSKAAATEPVAQTQVNSGDGSDASSQAGYKSAATAPLTVESLNDAIEYFDQRCLDEDRWEFERSTRLKIADDLRDLALHRQRGRKG